MFFDICDHCCGHSGCSSPELAQSLRFPPSHTLELVEGMRCGQKQSSLLRRLPAAEEAAGDCFWDRTFEHASARCNEIHAKILVRRRSTFRAQTARLMHACSHEEDERELVRAGWYSSARLVEHYVHRVALSFCTTLCKWIARRFV